RVPGTNDEFSSDDPTLRPGHSVVVEAEGGSDVAVVLSTKSADSHLARRVLRRLGEADWDAREKLENREAEALAYARSRVDALGLEMKIVSSQLTLAGTRLTLFFTGEERVDFRALVRDLAARFHTRIELRQIGVRDAARHTGGTGVCGRELCCSTFLPSFEPISIRMAKDQNLALQHEKLAGYCGRLRCCLQYEHGIYRDARKALPKLGKRVKTPNGDGRLKDVDVLKGRVRVQLDGGGFGEFDSGELGIPEEILQQQQRQREAEQERAESGGESKSAKRRRRRKKKKEDG
ncbi:MAG: regulatory iron-sulfur-containing complex subunit RicT, partial [Myxococcota bacterium]